MKKKSDSWDKAELRTLFKRITHQVLTFLEIVTYSTLTRCMAFMYRSQDI